MKRLSSLAVSLAERLCRPQRIGVFGHRGVGKTTLLTMLYRESVGGRLPELRLAAADARTAEYLSDKVLQLEAGQPLPGTLGETDLRFHLYYQDCRLDLLFKDYQGEHVALGRQEPIRNFLRDCDAVWLCLDVPVTDTPSACLQAEQEIEQAVEDYLIEETAGAPPRPMALVLTKADLLSADPAVITDVVEQHFCMTRHTLKLHSPQHAQFAVSSLGHPIPAAKESKQPFVPQPMGLQRPLIWLAETLQALDETRLNSLWELAGGDHALMERCVAAFSRRYPGTRSAGSFQRRLRELRRQRRRRRSLLAAILTACALFSVWTYDTWAKQRAAQSHAHEFAERLTQLRRHAADPDADAETVWQELQSFHRDFPEHDVDGDWRSFREKLKQRRDAERERRSETAFRELQRLGERSELSNRIDQADHFLGTFAGTAHELEVRRGRAACLLRLDERDIESARAYSNAHPLNFQTRRERYQRYLERRPDGAFAAEAKSALEQIDADWDKHDFRAVRDHYQAHPGGVKDLQSLCRSYLAVHSNGRFRTAARDLLRWTERVTEPGEYRVVLKSGSFDPKVAHFFSRGPSLSVEIEVNGIRYGPSNIVLRNYQPEWNYEFPRRIRWKLGDSVRIVVTDNYYWKRRVLDLVSEENDPVAMRLLSCEVCAGKNSLTFASDFTMPVMPAIE